jgi:hypothetical protein
MVAFTPRRRQVRDEKTVEGIPGLITEAPQEAPEGFRGEPRYERTWSVSTGTTGSR